MTASTTSEMIVVDGFYDDPDAVRRLALGAEYHDHGGKANFPGLESVKSFYTRAHAEKFAGIVGSTITYDPARWIFGKFRSATATQRGQTKVHVDRVDWTAVVYLSHGEDIEGGLGIYRHKELGMDRIPDAGDLHALGYRDIDDFDAREVYPVSLDDSKWDLIELVEIKYNRCIVFRGSRLFHAIVSTFGSNLHTGRLTHNFFFQQA
jgi:hypothetical protein